MKKQVITGIAFEKPDDVSRLAAALQLRELRRQKIKISRRKFDFGHTTQYEWFSGVKYCHVTVEC